MKHCSFCGLRESKDRKFIRGKEDTYICNSCASIAIEEFKRQKEVKVNTSISLSDLIDIENQILEDDNYKEDFKKEMKNIKAKEGYEDDEGSKAGLQKLDNLFSTMDDNFENNYSDYDKDYEFEEIQEEFKKINEDEFKNFTPKKIKDQLDQYIVGQEDAKKVLSVAIYNHYKRINSKKKINKGNILMVGPTGSGKTYILQKLSDIIGVPMVIADATSMTEAGYVGADVEDMISDLYLKSGKDKDLTEKGIIYIDEIDKISSKQQDATSAVDVGGVGVQQSLLKIMEGSEITISSGNNYEGDVKINTENILFVCGGAFSGFDKFKKEKKKTLGKIGFSREEDKEENKEDKNKVLTHDDIIDYGFIPEFVGRVPVLVELNALNQKDLVNILTSTKDSIVEEYVELLKMDGIELTFEEEALEEVAKQALNKNIGARGLRGVLEQKMYEVMFDAPESKDDKIVITKEMVSNI